jgi:hypothetical protein
MGTLEMFHDHQDGWLSGEAARPEGRKRAPDDQQGLRGARRFRHKGGETELQLYEVRLEPNQRVDTHAHAEDEILFVVSGSMRFGSQVLTAGSSVSIPGMTLYTFESGPDGLQFLNFRPRHDVSHFTRSQFMEMRAAAKAGETTSPPQG